MNLGKSNQLQREGIKLYIKEFENAHYLSESSLQETEKNIIKTVDELKMLGTKHQ